MAILISSVYENNNIEAASEQLSVMVKEGCAVEDRNWTMDAYIDVGLLDELMMVSDVVMLMQ